jgi:hypothetical protein
MLREVCATSGTLKDNDSKSSSFHNKINDTVYRNPFVKYFVIKKLYLITIAPIVYSLKKLKELYEKL